MSWYYARILIILTIVLILILAALVASLPPI
jgi:hypothetical protein